MAGIAPAVTAHLMVVNLQLVQIKVYGIVAMANVFHQAMFAMAQMNSAMLDGDLTVPMAQMKA
jgi:hypothetical protein